MDAQSVVLGHFTVEMPREMEKFNKNKRDLFSDAPATVLGRRVEAGEGLPEGAFRLAVTKLEISLPDINFRVEGSGGADPVELRSGAVHLLRGENGSGKTTFLRLLSGELQDIGPELKYEMVLHPGNVKLKYDSTVPEGRGGDLFSTAFLGNFVATLSQDSGEQLKNQTYGDVYFRFNDFCDPASPAGGDGAYRFVGGDGAVELQLRTWLMSVLDYIISITSMVGEQGARDVKVRILRVAKRQAK